VNGSIEEEIEISENLTITNWTNLFRILETNLNSDNY